MSIMTEAADEITLFLLVLLLLFLHVPKSLHLSAIDGWFYLGVVSVLAFRFSFKYLFWYTNIVWIFVVSIACSYSYFYINTFFDTVSIINVSI